MTILKGIFYTQEHEWAAVDGKRAKIGITHHAQAALGDIVFVEVPEVGRSVKKGEAIGVVESVKAVSDLFSPLSGTVVESNAALKDTPDVLNKDPYSAGWIAVIEMADSAEKSTLLDADAYQKLLDLEAK